MSNREIKQEIKTRILSRNIWNRQVSDTEICTRCPWCGDSQKNQRTGHLYIKININDNYPIVYNCFKCPAHGVLSYEDLEVLGVEDGKLREKIQTLNKTSEKIPNNFNQERPDRYFEYKLPKVLSSDDVYGEMKKIEYVENRLGIKFTDEDLKDIKIITSFKDFLKLNDITSITCKSFIALKLQDHYVGFLSNNNSHILFRDITDKEEYRWIKYPITEESRTQKLIYGISNEIDIFSQDNITINLSEGVMDCLSIAYNIDDGDLYNNINIAVCGKYYTNTIRKLIGMGLVGSNVTINIYSDNDHTNDTSLEYYRKTLHRFTFLYKEINVIYNLKSKDCGVRKSDILLQKHKL